MDSAGEPIDDLLVSGSISGSADAIRHRVQNISFNNTTELNSTIYFCRANNSEFNYSSNPTYLSSSQIRVKELSTDNPVSYVTTVGLYSEDNALLAVAKLSEPIKKTPAEEYTLRVRLDY
jgi:transcription termination factor Rho